MTHCSRTYRLQFLDTLTSDAPAILSENELLAADIEGALWGRCGRWTTCLGRPALLPAIFRQLMAAK